MFSQAQVELFITSVLQQIYYNPAGIIKVTIRESSVEDIGVLQQTRSAMQYLFSATIQFVISVWMENKKQTTDNILLVV